MKKLIKKFLTEEDGVTAIEYALIASLIAMAIIVTVGEAGQKVSGLFATVETKFP
jgi:pilus assembly protein Flp/PilA